MCSSSLPSWLLRHLHPRVATLSPVPIQTKIAQKAQNLWWRWQRGQEHICSMWGTVWPDFSSGLLLLCIQCAYSLGERHRPLEASASQKAVCVSHQNCCHQSAHPLAAVVCRDTLCATTWPKIWNDINKCDSTLLVFRRESYLKVTAFWLCLLDKNFTLGGKLALSRIVNIVTEACFLIHQDRQCCLF